MFSLEFLFYMLKFFWYVTSKWLVCTTYKKLEHVRKCYATIFSDSFTRISISKPINLDFSSYLCELIKN